MSNVSWTSFDVDRNTETITRQLGGKKGHAFMQEIFNNKFPNQEEGIFETFTKERLNLKNYQEILGKANCPQLPLVTAVEEDLKKLDNENGKRYQDDDDATKDKLRRIALALIDSFINNNVPGKDSAADDDAAAAAAGGAAGAGGARDDGAGNAGGAGGGAGGANGANEDQQNGNEDEVVIDEDKTKKEKSKKEIPNLIFSPTSKSDYYFLEEHRPGETSIHTVAAVVYNSGEQGKNSLLKVLQMKDIEYSGDLVKDTHAAETRILRLLCDRESQLGQFRLELYDKYNRLHEKNKVNENTLYDLLLYRAAHRKECGKADYLNEEAADAANAVYALEKAEEKKTDAEVAALAAKLDEEERLALLAQAEKRLKDGKTGGLGTSNLIANETASMTAAEKQRYFLKLVPSNQVPKGFSNNLREHTVFVSSDLGGTWSAVEAFFMSDPVKKELDHEEHGCTYNLVMATLYETTGRVVNKAVMDGPKSGTVAKDVATEKQEKHVAFVTHIFCNYVGSFDIMIHFHGIARILVVVYDAQRLNTTDRVTGLIQNLQAYNSFPDQTCVIIGELLNVTMCMTEACCYANDKSPKDFYHALAGSLPTRNLPPSTHGYIKSESLKQAKLYLGTRGFWANVLLAVIGGIATALSKSPQTTEAEDGDSFLRKLPAHVCTSHIILSGNNVNDGETEFNTLFKNYGGMVQDEHDGRFNCGQMVEKLNGLRGSLADFNHLAYKGHPSTGPMSAICFSGLVPEMGLGQDSAGSSTSKPPLAPSTSTTSKAPTVSELPPQHFHITINSPDGSRSKTAVDRMRTEVNPRSGTPDIRLTSKDRRDLAEHTKARQELAERRSREQDTKQGNDQTHRSNTPSKLFDMTPFLDTAAVMKNQKEALKKCAMIAPHADCPLHPGKPHKFRDCGVVKKLNEEELAALERQIAYAKGRTKP